MQGGANSAKAGRFEGFVIGSEGRVNLVGARVELFSGVPNFATKIAKEATESDNEDKKDDAASGDFDNCSLGDVTGGLFYRAVGFGDLIQVFKAIHKHIITQQGEYNRAFRDTMSRQPAVAGVAHLRPRP